MEFRILTLIDITETGQHRGPDKKLVGQQSNYNSLVQTIGLRANPTPKGTIQHEGKVDSLGFGSNFKGKHKYWEFLFDIEYGDISLDHMQEDFNLIPIVSGLDETAKIDIPVFDTKNEKTKNVVFVTRNFSETA